MSNTNLLNKKKLLEALDVLGYSARMQKIALLGRESKDAAAYSRLLSSLLEDGAYEAHPPKSGICRTGSG